MFTCNSETVNATTIYWRVLFFVNLSFLNYKGNWKKKRIIFNEERLKQEKKKIGSKVITLNRPFLKYLGMTIDRVGTLVRDNDVKIYWKRDDCIPGTTRTLKNEKSFNKDDHAKFEHSQILGAECCKVCGKSVSNLKKHMKSHNPDKHTCHICLITLTRSDNLKRHIKLKHSARESSYSNSNIQLKHFLAKPDSRSFHFT